MERTETVNDEMKTLAAAHHSSDISEDGQVNMHMLIRNIQNCRRRLLLAKTPILVEQNVPVNIEKSKSIKAIIRHGWAQMVSFSCLRRLKTCSKGGRRVCGKGTTFTVLWTNQMLSLCLLCFATLAAMTAMCKIFNLLHFRSTVQGGGAWPKWPNGIYATDAVWTLAITDAHA